MRPDLYNMMDIQAALGIHQLKRVEKNLKKREYIWNIYNEELQNLPIVLPPSPKKDSSSRHARHLYTLIINNDSKIDRDAFLNKMQEFNIGLGVHYLSIPEHPYYKKNFGWKPSEYPNAMKVGRSTVSLPIGPSLNEQDIYDVINAVRKTLN